MKTVDVVLVVTVDRDGNVSDVRVADSGGAAIRRGGDTRGASVAVHTRDARGVNQWRPAFGCHFTSPRRSTRLGVRQRPRA